MLGITAVLRRPACLALVCVSLGWSGASIGGCERVFTGSDASEKRAASKAQRDRQRPEPPPPPECKDGETTTLRCLAYCGSIRILSNARCVQSKYHCDNGVREDRCD